MLKAVVVVASTGTNSRNPILQAVKLFYLEGFEINLKFSPRVVLTATSK